MLVSDVYEKDEGSRESHVSNFNVWADSVILFPPRHYQSDYPQDQEHPVCDQQA